MSEAPDNITELLARRAELHAPIPASWQNIHVQQLAEAFVAQVEAVLGDGRGLRMPDYQRTAVVLPFGTRSFEDGESEKIHQVILLGKYIYKDGVRAHTFAFKGYYFDRTTEDIFVTPIHATGNGIADCLSALSQRPEPDQEIMSVRPGALPHYYVNGLATRVDAPMPNGLSVYASNPDRLRLAL